MSASPYAVELRFVDRSRQRSISEPLTLEAGNPIPGIGDTVCLTERDTDYSAWTVKSREFMYLTPQRERSVVNLRVTLHCDRNA